MKIKTIDDFEKESESFGFTINKEELKDPSLTESIQNGYVKPEEASNVK